MLSTLLLVLAVLLAAVLIVAAFQPSEYRYERSATINAPASAIFPHVNSQRAWAAWSPWMKMEPTAKVEITGPESGVGATATWEGKKIGAGTSTITESEENKRIRFRLDFKKPFEGTSTAEFTFLPEGNATNVTWSMEGHANYMSKLFGLIMNCKKMMSKQFDQGLNDLKTISEQK